jgi:hypothetical protein
MPTAATLDKFQQLVNGKLSSQDKLAIFKEEIAGLRSSFKKVFENEPPSSSYLFEKSLKHVLYDPDTSNLVGWSVSESLVSLIEQNTPPLEPQPNSSYSRKRLVIEHAINLFQKYESALPFPDFALAVFEFGDFLMHELGQYDLGDFLCYGRVEAAIHKIQSKREAELNGSMSITEIAEKLNSIGSFGSSIALNSSNGSMVSEVLFGETQNPQSAGLEPFIVNITLKRLECRIIALTSDDRFFIKSESRQGLLDLVEKVVNSINYASKISSCASLLSRGLELVKQLCDECSHTGLVSEVQFTPFIDLGE